MSAEKRPNFHPKTGVKRIPDPGTVETAKAEPVQTDHMQVSLEVVNKRAVSETDDSKRSGSSLSYKVKHSIRGRLRITLPRLKPCF